MTMTGLGRRLEWSTSDWTDSNSTVCIDIWSSSNWVWFLDELLVLYNWYTNANKSLCSPRAPKLRSASLKTSNPVVGTSTEWSTNLSQMTVNSAFKFARTSMFCQMLEYPINMSCCCHLGQFCEPQGRLAEHEGVGDFSICSERRLHEYNITLQTEQMHRRLCTRHIRSYSKRFFEQTLMQEIDIHA